MIGLKQNQQCIVYTQIQYVQCTRIYVYFMCTCILHVFDFKFFETLQCFITGTAAFSKTIIAVSDNAFLTYHYLFACLKFYYCWEYLVD